MAVAAIATYLSALPNDFVSDAVNLIRSNRAIVNSHEWLAWFTRTYTFGSVLLDPRLYRPFTVLSYVVTARIWGPSPLTFLAGNVLIHAGVSLLVLAMGRRLLGETAGLLGALLFAVHPLHTEAVAWIGGRPDLLMTVFAAASALCFLRATEPGATRPALFAGATVVSYFAALLSKEHAVVLPAWFAVAWLIERRRRPVRWAAVTVAGSALALLAFLAIRHQIVAPISQLGESGQHLGSPWALWRGLTVLAIAGHYAGLFLWPGPLTFDNWVYGMVSVQSMRGLGLAELWGATVVAALVVGTIGSARRAPGLAQALAFTAVTYTVVSTAPPSPLLFVAERLMYLPSVGACLAGGWLLAVAGRWTITLRAAGQAEAAGNGRSPISTSLRELAGGGWRAWATVGVGLTLLLALSVRSAVRNLDWRSTESISRASLALNPDSPQALAGLGNLAFDRKDYAEAERLLLQSLRINPKNWPTYVLLLGVYDRTGEPDKTLALFADGVKAMPERPEPYHHLGGFLWRAGRLAEAEARFREAIARRPKFLLSYLALGGVLLDQGRPGEASEAFRTASELAPDNPMPWIGLARSAQALGRGEDARHYAVKAQAAAHRRPQEVGKLPAHADPNFGR